MKCWKGGLIYINGLHLHWGSTTALWFTVLFRIEGKVQMRQEFGSAPVSLMYVPCVEIMFF